MDKEGDSMTDIKSILKLYLWTVPEGLVEELEAASPPPGAAGSRWGRGCRRRTCP